ncbi:MAG: helix-turn-helix domain-containing protein [Clostridia bacterium]|nr:helix-turn-helix domain-containing protein [Clostridia bacterium]
MSRLGDTIRTARVKAGMTEKALGRKCGLAESYIKDVESGRRIVSDDQAQRILNTLGVDNPISTELEVAAEPPMKPRPRPRAYVLPVEAHAAPDAQAQAESNDAWLDALGGVVKRVPVMSPDGVVIDHVLTPIVAGKIEGGAPDKVLYYRCPDDRLRGFRVYAGDLLLVVPASKAEDDRLMLVEYEGNRMVRKLLKLDGGRIQMQAFDHEFTAVVGDLQTVRVLGRCVKLVRTL